MKINKDKKKKTRTKSLGLGKARGAYSKVYPRAGRYVGTIDKFVYGESQKTENAPKKPYFLAKHTVVRVDPGGPTINVRGKPVPFHPLGEDLGVFNGQDDYGFWLSGVKNFLMEALGQTDEVVNEIAGQLLVAVEAGELPDELADYAEYVEDIEDEASAVEAVWSAIVDHATSDEQPLAGGLICWTASPKLMKGPSEDVAAGKLAEEDLEEKHYRVNVVYQHPMSYSDFAESSTSEEMAALRRVLPDIQARIEAEQDELAEANSDD